jgi:hypothetical protein
MMSMGQPSSRWRNNNIYSGRTTCCRSRQSRGTTSSTTGGRGACGARASTRDETLVQSNDGWSASDWQKALQQHTSSHRHHGTPHTKNVESPSPPPHTPHRTCTVVLSRFVSNFFFATFSRRSRSARFRSMRCWISCCHPWESFMHSPMQRRHSKQRQRRVAGMGRTVVGWWSRWKGNG